MNAKPTSLQIALDMPRPWPDTLEENLAEYERELEVKKIEAERLESERKELKS